MKLATNEAGELQKFFSVASIAEALSVHEDTVLRKIHSGEIKAIRWGEKALRISEEELERFMQQNQVLEVEDAQEAFVDPKAEQKQVEKDMGLDEPKHDPVVEEYSYRDCKIEILQFARTVKTAQPKYFALSSLPGGKETWGRPIGIGPRHEFQGSVEELKKAAEAYVDKRIRWQEMRQQRKASKVQ